MAPAKTLFSAPSLMDRESSFCPAEKPASPQPGTAPASGSAALAFGLAGLCFLLAALGLPFVQAAKFGQGNEGRMLSGAHSLWEQGHWGLALLVAVCGFIAPMLLLAGIVVATLPFARPPWVQGSRTLLRVLEPWSMPEVRVLAILVAFLKLSALVEASPAAGLWCYAGASVCSLAALRLLPGGPLQHEVDRPVSHATACGLGALALLVPAYSLPVMSFMRVGSSHADTLLASVAKLWHGGMWGIALVVFTASILVPLLKLVGLAVLVAATRWHLGISRASLERLYAWVHGIGRWSMLDVFLVAFLCGIVDFGDLAQIEARPGVLAFAGAVVLTMIATASFDTRRLLYRPSPEHPSSLPS